MSDAPEELWLRRSDTGTWHQHILRPPEPDAVRYVRADLVMELTAKNRCGEAEGRPAGRLLARATGADCR